MKKTLAKKLKKSSLLKKRLGLKDYPKEGKKFIIVQIDALAYSILQDLRKTNYMPFLNKLLKSYHVTKFEPGYPSTTPFVQAGIMYNDNSNIPGFSFFDKKKEKKYVMVFPESARAIEDELSKKNYGILTGGSSIGNVFCGGAKRSIFTIAHLFRTDTGAKTVRDVLFIVFLNPLSTLKVLSFSLYELLIEVYESFLEVVSSIFHRKEFNWPFFYPYFPLFRMIINSIVREVTTEASVLEMERNVPYIYTTYVGYDWISHYRGPRAISSFSLLTQIDFSVRKLYKKAVEKGYDFYVISDHGQVPAIPFDRLYHESFEDFLERVSNMEAGVESTHGVERGSRAKYLGYKLGYYYKQFSLPLRAGVYGLLKVFKKTFKQKEKSSKKFKPLTVLFSSSLAHLYFTYTKRKMSLEDIEKKHLFLVSRIVNHPGVGFVIGRSEKGVEVIADSGKVVINGEKVKFVGEHFLKKYGDEGKLVKQLQEFAQLKYGGDLIINGDYNGERIVAFDDFHLGSHDAVGGEQSDAFFISKEKVDLSHVLNSKDLYHLFIQYHDLKKGL